MSEKPSMAERDKARSSGQYWGRFDYGWEVDCWYRRIANRFMSQHKVVAYNAACAKMRERIIKEWADYTDPRSRAKDGAK